MPAGDLTFQGDLLLRILVAGLGAGGRRVSGKEPGRPTPPAPLPAPALCAPPAAAPATGAGQYVLAAVTAVIVVVSLGPLNRLVSALRPRAPRSLQIRLQLTDLEAPGRISALFAELRVEMTAIERRGGRKGR